MVKRITFAATRPARNAPAAGALALSSAGASLLSLPHSKPLTAQGKPVDLGVSR